MASPALVTPKRFAVGGFGIDTASLTAPQLRSTLTRASQLATTWCNKPLLPSRFDFRGGTVTDEEHIFPVPNPLIAYAGSRRVFPYQRPLRTVTAFSIQFTNTYSIDLNPATDIFVNRTEGWCEIVASQPTIIGYPPIGYWFGLFEPLARISYTYGWRDEIIDDVCEADSPTVYYASYGQWDAAADIEVKADGVVVASGYTTNAADGTITFATEPDAGVEITCSYTATLPDAVTQAVGLIAVDLIGESRIAARGMVGLSSLKVAEVSLTAMAAGQGKHVTQNGVSIPAAAAAYLAPFALGSQK